MYKRQEEEEISVLRYDKLLSEYVRSNSFSAMQKLTIDVYKRQYLCRVIEKLVDTS